jgi:hypothetical protein
LTFFEVLRGSKKEKFGFPKVSNSTRSFKERREQKDKSDETLFKNEKWFVNLLDWKKSQR